MTSALLALSAGEGTTDQHLASIILARKINTALGGAILSPWDVEELPDGWLDAVKALTDQLPEIRRGRRQVEKKLEEIRKRHPNYKG